jgi:hypothetical protein
VLEVLEAVPANFPSLELAAPRAGSSVVLLGYPAGVGFRPDGRLAFDGDEGRTALAPQVMLGRVSDAHEVDVLPLVGCVPEGGMSGGPVVDDAGRLIAVLSSVSHTHSNADVRILVEAAPLDRAAAWLAENGTK